ncbi:MAG: HAD-IIIC family phosphatase [Propionibacteriales bacterium]|nr:HAD-IIIC family phosphatase [Propionibacteriales bacterium]
MTGTISTLREAMTAIGQARELPEGTPSLAVGIACSFTPLHLQTFLHASVQQASPGRRVSVLPGLYGPLPESIQHVAGQKPDLCAVVVEWSDLDPRLGVRESATARRAEIDDLSRTAQARLDRIHDALAATASVCPVAVVLPTLDLPFIYAAAPGRAGMLEARLESLVAGFRERILGHDGIRVAVPVGGRSRRDLQSDLRSGFPFTSERAAEIADAAARALVRPPAKKGLITDLDDTLWRGLVGEIGVGAVTWDLDSGSLVHGLYQQLLAELSRRGALVGVCSKNDPDVVAAALARPDLLVAPDALFPVEASWGLKSAAVAAILKSWNISAQDVVFVDDSDLELAEVAAAHPGITTRKFPTQDPRAAGDLLNELNDLFWRERLTAEDAVRTSSLRASAALEEAREGSTDPVQFLRDLQGRIDIDEVGAWESARAVELINKTNQFNLNGRRVGEVEWRTRGEADGAFGWSVSYTDKFGTLGAISVLSGVLVEDTLTIDSWVLSCRAFSRTIEHHVLAALVERYRPATVRFEFEPTERNGVVAQLMTALGYTEAGVSGVDAARMDLSGSTGIHTVDFVSP